MTNFGVPASANGYVDQFIAALLILLGTVRSGRPAEMVVEGLDDIELRESDNVFETVQVKSHIAPGNLTDRSADLWKTVRVWCDLKRSGQIDFTTTTLTLLTTRAAATGSACAMLGLENRAPRNAETILTAIAREKTPSNQDGYDAYNALSPAERHQLVTAARIIDKAASTPYNLERLRSELSITASDDARVEHVVLQVLGWWLTRVQSNMKTPNDSIRGSELTDAVRRAVREVRAETLPISPEILAYTREWDSKDETFLFIRQLRLVDAPEQVVVGALSDYLRLSHQLSEWIRTSLLFADDHDLYRRELIDTWTLPFHVMCSYADGADSSRQKRLGLDLFVELMKQDRPIKPECRTTFIMRGFYHSLANELAVGWHPLFQEALK